MKKVIVLSTLVSAGLFAFLLFSTQFCGELDFINHQTREKYGGTYCGFELPFMNIMYEVGYVRRWYLLTKYYPQLVFYFLVIWFLTFAVVWFLRRRKL
ncbi:hypothetical protein HYW61_00890 [candidate division WWE3 bacterium]|nr:hypothetical protein [candidate division WWE3 bacterium]